MRGRMALLCQNSDPRTVITGHCFSVDAVNAHANQLIDAEVVHSARAQVADIFRRDLMDAHRYEFIRVGMLVAKALQLVD